MDRWRYEAIKRQLPLYLTQARIPDGSEIAINYNHHIFTYWDKYGWLWFMPYSNVARGRGIAKISPTRGKIVVPYPSAFNSIVEDFAREKGYTFQRRRVLQFPSRTIPDLAYIFDEINHPRRRTYA